MVFGQLRRKFFSRSMMFLPWACRPVYRLETHTLTHSISSARQFQNIYTLTPKLATVPYLSADLSKDWQLPDKEFSALSKGSSICKANYAIKSQP